MDEACEHIKTSGAVVFVGYRFPPTDAIARETLLGAIGASSVNKLHLHIVLGPDSPDARRLEELLIFACRRAGRFRENEGRPARGYFTVHHHRLYSQDFFSVLDRAALLHN